MINFDLKGNNIKQTIFIITGKIGSGKTTFLAKLVKRLQEGGITVSGFLAVRSSVNESGQDYDLILPDTNESIPLSSRKFNKGWPKTGNFYFNPEALKRGNGILSNPQILNRDMIVVDEIGIFELEGLIWADAVSRLIEKNVGFLLWVVRNTLVEEVIRKWDLKNPITIDIEKVSLPDAEKLIIGQF